MDGKRKEKDKEEKKRAQQKTEAVSEVDLPLFFLCKNV